MLCSWSSGMHLLEQWHSCFSSHRREVTASVHCRFQAGSISSGVFQKRPRQSVPEVMSCTFESERKDHRKIPLCLPKYWLQPCFSIPCDMFDVAGFHHSLRAPNSDEGIPFSKPGAWAWRCAVFKFHSSNSDRRLVTSQSSRCCSSGGLRHCLPSTYTSHLGGTTTYVAPQLLSWTVQVVPLLLLFSKATGAHCCP